MTLRFLPLAILLVSVLGALALAEAPLLRISYEDEPTTLSPTAAKTPTDRFVASFLESGAYLLAGWERGRRIVLEGNPEFKGTRPVYRIEMIFGPHEQLLERFRKGQIDILVGPSADDIMTLPDARIEAHPALGGRYLVWSQGRAGAKDRTLRTLIASALPLHKFPAAIRIGDRAVAASDGYSLERARTLREVEIGGGRISLRLLIRSTTIERRVAAWIAEQLGPLRIELKITERRGADFWEALKKRPGDLTLVTWTSAREGDSEIAEYAGVPSQSDAILKLSQPNYTFLLSARVKRFGISASGLADLSQIEVLEK